MSPWIPYFFLGIIGGVIVDRVDRKAIMLFCGWTRGLLTLSIPIAHAADVLTLEHIMIVSFVMTCLRAFFFPAIQASIPLLAVDKKDLNISIGVDPRLWKYDIRHDIDDCSAAEDPQRNVGKGDGPPLQRRQCV